VGVIVPRLRVLRSVDTASGLAMKEKALAAYIVSSQDAEMIESLHTAIEKLEKRRGKWRVDGD
jgi:hypothetical protein